MLSVCFNAVTTSRTKGVNVLERYNERYKNSKYISADALILTCLDEYCN